MQVSLLHLVMWLEQVGQYIHEVTHKSTPQIVLDVVKNTDTMLTFKVFRGKKKVLIDVWLDVDTQKTERVHIRGKRDVDDLADLKDCICAKLSSGLRMLNLLKSILRDHLRMKEDEDSLENKLYIVPGDIELWFDEDDKINVTGGSYLSGIRTYEADEKVPINGETNTRFYFEDPFEEKLSESAIHSLMPNTIMFLSDVLGTLGFETLEEWIKPLPNDVQVFSQKNKEKGMAVDSELHGG
jgi:hypothetical protein